jgi:hypothetical protein
MAVSKERLPARQTAAEATELGVKQPDTAKTAAVEGTVQNTASKKNDDQSVIANTKAPKLGRRAKTKKLVFAKTQEMEELEFVDFKNFKQQTKKFPEVVIRSTMKAVADKYEKNIKPETVCVMEQAAEIFLSDLTLQSFGEKSSTLKGDVSLR